MPRRAPSFDRDYYARFYENPSTRVASRADTDRLSRFVCSAVAHFGIEVRRVLDVGCGLGHFRAGVARTFPRARYTGLEISEYLCAKYGFEHGSVVDYRARSPFDLVVCRGVLPYLRDTDARRAIKNLATLCRGALYLEAVAREDFRAGIVDETKTDASMKRRPSAFYANAWARSLVRVGGGLWIAKAAEVPLYALERAAVK